MFDEEGKMDKGTIKFVIEQDSCRAEVIILPAMYEEARDPRAYIGQTAIDLYDRVKFMVRQAERIARDEANA